MTKQEYLDVLDFRFEHGLARFLDMISHMPKEAFLAQASAAWDRARLKYGPECDLLKRDLFTEAAKEAVDGVVYCCFDAE